MEDGDPSTLASVISIRLLIHIHTIARKTSRLGKSVERVPLPEIGFESSHAESTTNISKAACWNEYIVVHCVSNRHTASSNSKVWTSVKGRAFILRCNQIRSVRMCFSKRSHILLTACKERQRHIPGIIGSFDSPSLKA